MRRTSWIPAALVTAAALAGSVLFLSGCEDQAAANVLGSNEAGVVEAPETANATQGASVMSAGGMGLEESGPEDVASGLMALEDLVEDAPAYVGRTVTVRGTILAQCIRGCRFTIDDGTGVVNIELVDDALENVLLQGSVGRIVEVSGVVDTASPPRVLVDSRSGWSYVD